MSPNIIKKESFHLIGYSLPTNLHDEEEREVINQSIMQLKSVEGEIPNKIRDDILVLQIYPQMEQFNPFIKKERLIIGFEVSKLDQIPQNTNLYTIEENMYVKCKHRGNRTDIYKTYDYLYNNWLHQNRCVPLGYDMEVWNKNGESNICIAVNKIS